MSFTHPSPHVASLCVAAQWAIPLSSPVWNLAQYCSRPAPCMQRRKQKRCGGREGTKGGRREGAHLHALHEIIVAWCAGSTSWGDRSGEREGKGRVRGARKEEDVRTRDVRTRDRRTRPAHATGLAGPHQTVGSSSLSHDKSPNRQGKEGERGRCTPDTSPISPIGVFLPLALRDSIHRDDADCKKSTRNERHPQDGAPRARRGSTGLEPYLFRGRGWR